MTLAQWYHAYNRPEYFDSYFVVPNLMQQKGKANAKVLAFSVELYINVGQVRKTSEFFSSD